MRQMDHPSQPARLLIADDQPQILTALGILLKPQGFQIETATTSAGILETLRERDFDAVLMDLNYTRGSTTGQEGLDLLARIREIDATLPVIVMTAWSSVELAVEAMRRGARDFIAKPWKNERLLTILRTQFDLSRALRQSRRLEQENRILREGGRGPLIAQSRGMQPVLELIQRVGPSEANILITGENGTGKSLVASLLHELSGRAAKPLVTLDVGSLPGNLFESELFGHVRGAFTDARADRIGRLEMAHGGTLFLDEISNISLELQAKLLRVLETGQFEPVGSSRTRRVDARILSATNAPIEKEVKEGRFRQDLLYRLNTVEIHLPPLRERQEDIPLLARHFLERYALRYRKTEIQLAPSVIQALLEFDWPGNIRELAHVVERAVLMSHGREIQGADLGLCPLRPESRPIDDLSLEEVERLLIQRAIARYHGNMSEVAQALGLSRSALYRRLEKHELK